MENQSMQRMLESQTVEGEIGLVIEYRAGEVLAVDVLQSALSMVEALDALDAALLSSVDTSLQPVSVLNDVQHSSLKILLARALKNLSDEHLASLEWKKWAGALLVKGKHKLLKKLGADTPEIQRTLDELAVDYKACPTALIGYQPPKVASVSRALATVSTVRQAMGTGRVTVQTELGDVEIESKDVLPVVPEVLPQQTIVNRGIEFFKVKSSDMLGQAQWTVMRAGRALRVEIMHKAWLAAYQARQVRVEPGDSLKCSFEETVSYDGAGNEVGRELGVIEVLAVSSPPKQHQLTM